MNRFKKVISIMLVVILSMASLSAVSAAEEQSGQDSVASDVQGTLVEGMVDEEAGFNESEDAEPTVTPEVTDIPEETPEPTAIPQETLEPKQTVVPEVTVNPVKNAKDATTGEGWQGSGNRWQYFAKDSSGKVAPVSGWRDIAGQKFYFDPSDSNYAASGWKEIAAKIYYFQNTGLQGSFGAMLVGWQNISSKIYFFKDSGGNGTKGEMLVGWQSIKGNIFYFKGSGDLGAKGTLLTGWRKIKKQWFYFKNTGDLGTKGMVLQGWQKLKYVDESTGKTKKGYFYLSKAKAIGSKGKMLTGLRKISGKRYYMNKSGVRQKSKWIKVSGSWYYFDKNGQALTGWNYVKGLKYYFSSKGKLSQDVRSKVSGPYSATVNRKTCVVTIYAKDGDNGYTIPVKAFACSVGLPDTPTPTGTFYTPAKYRVKELMGPSWGQYATRIVGGVLFHSVAGTPDIPYNISAGEYNRLGSPASHGCVRLCVRDAKWIYENCQLGMKVTISDTAFQPFDKPSTIKIPASQNWDPTDPAVKK